MAMSQSCASATRNVLGRSIILAMSLSGRIDAPRPRCVRSPANRLSLDYESEAGALPAAPVPIIDVHTHVGGPEAASIYRRVADLYGVRLVYSMTQLEQIEPVREVLGDRIRFIAVPNYHAEDKRHHLGPGYVQRIEAFHAAGARLAKFWAAPRAIDYGLEFGDPESMRLDAPARMDAMQAAHDLGMYFMTHVADPDIWFRTRYADAARYGTKRAQYEPFEALLERFDQPWIAAHMGGWPEDLEMLTGLLEGHRNLYLDTSATKWMVRELSRHRRRDLQWFLDRFRGRILFGSDIVAADEHLTTSEGPHGMYAQAASPAQAFDLYASRYWALRTLLETRYVGQSPIADPDLMLLDPERYGPMDAPALIGKQLPRELLASLYFEAADSLLEPLHVGETKGLRD
jgi:hypothetical protein